MTATRRSEHLLLVNIHSNGRSSCSLAALKEVAAVVLAIFGGGVDVDDEDDVFHFAFLFLSEGISNAEKKCLAKGDIDDVSTANAIPLA